MTIIIDPFVNVYYASFYIRGLIEKFGNASLTFHNAPFRSLQNRTSCFNFVIRQNGKSTNVTIDAGDFDTIDHSCYQWCDIYGKVNTNWGKTPKSGFPKMVSLAPGFGIRVWNLPQTMYYATTNLLKTPNITGSRKFIGKYKRQFSLRLPIEAYTPEPAQEKYIFHVSTLWQNDEYNQNDERVNIPRANFMEVCKSLPEINFEGGFYFSGTHPLNERFKDLVFHGYLPPETYLQKTKASTVVFNTPAFWNCHGWKLGEYLALGKAIISTPLSNALPEPLIHGENIHIIHNNRDEMDQAIRLLLHDTSYRHKLEQGALAYYLRNATPEKAISLLGI